VASDPFHTPGSWLGELNWLEARQRIRAGAVAVLPVGAGAKEHGPHLPLESDLLQCRWISERLLERRNVLVWPPLSYGHYPAFSSYAGSASLRLETFVNLAGDIVDSILQGGSRQLVLLNSGISTIEPLERIARPHDVVSLIHIYSGPCYESATERMRQQRHGTHADELETSLMLAIATDAVRMDLAPDWDAPAFEPGPLSPDDPDHPNYSPTGVYGNPALATFDKGLELAQAMLDDVIAAFDRCTGVNP
jgi:creatinine amidohydrolase